MTNLELARRLASLAPAPTAPGAILAAHRNAIPWARAAEQARRMGVEITAERLRRAVGDSPSSRAIRARLAALLGLAPAGGPATEAPRPCPPGVDLTRPLPALRRELGATGSEVARWRRRAGVAGKAGPPLAARLTPADTLAAVVDLMAPEDRGGEGRAYQLGALSRLATQLGVDRSLLSVAIRKGATVAAVEKWRATLRTRLLAEK